MGNFKKYKNRNNYINASSINKYNNFLLHLDNTTNENDENREKLEFIHTTKLTNADCKPHNNSNNNLANITNCNKECCDDISSKVSTLFKKSEFKSSFFSGARGDDLLSLQLDDKNPNLYLEIKNTNSPSKIQPRKMPKKSFFINCDLLGESINTSNKETVTNDITPKQKIHIDATIQNVDDLLKLIEDYKLDSSIKYNINMKALHDIKSPLLELKNMIGMKDLKTNIVDQIIYFVQELHQNKGSKDNNIDFMHTVIYGPPGTGKTEIAKIMGKIYSKIGILKKGTFKKVTRSDLIAGYLGQTALKTKDVINDCLGGVLFIDEAYALGNDEKRDSFSKECIDTLCEALSDNKENLMVIIAGYENELNDCFFNYNQGLDSRFVWRFKTDEYKADDLLKIFVKKVYEIGWSLHEDSKITAEWFKKNIDYFKFYGRDIETFLSKTKIAHSRRVFCKSEEEKRKLVASDLDKGLEMFLKNENVKSRKDKEEMNRIINSIYV